MSQVTAPVPLTRREAGSRHAARADGVGYVHLQTSSPETFAAAVRFYGLLGFVLISNLPRQSARRISVISAACFPNAIKSPSRASGGGGGGGGAAPAILEDGWLHLFHEDGKSIDSTTSASATIRLSLTSSASSASGGSGGSAGHTPVMPSATGDSDTMSVSFVARDIDALATALEDAGHPTSRIPKDTSGNDYDVLVIDPLGNRVRLSEDGAPFVPPPELYSTPESHKKTQSDLDLSKLQIGVSSSVSKSGSSRPKRIGVLTSGGDSQGMNAAVRAVVRMAIAYNAEPYAIHEGYQGLIDGGDKIEKMGWDSVHGYLPVGGTIIGTARCKDFREKSGRRTATLHLIEAGIDALVVIGGDGSLTGADSLRAEWPELVKSLLDDGLISNEDALHFAHLTIVGLVGSIDNDMALTEYTIGAVSSLHRICESVDAIASTAMSHMRAFVVEVMGRHCGWLALMAAICTGADWLFVPERPPEGDDWETHMCDTLIRHRNTLSKRGIIVIVAEGAIDRNLKPITAEQVRILLTERCKFDTRVTQLGHVQRGGTPCFFDRYLGTIQGVAAVEAIMKATPDMPSPMIGFRGNQVQSIPLMEAVKSTHSISESISNRDFDKAVDLRSDEFRNMFDMYESSTHLEFSFSKQNTIGGGSDGGDSENNTNKNDVVGDDDNKVSKHEPIRIAIMHVGAPAAGMNAATRAAAMAAINKGHVALEIINGFPGLIRGEVSELTAERVEGWTTKGGSELGTNRDQPGVHLGMIAYQMQRHKIHALIIIGGFEAFTGICTLYENRSTYPAFMIPMVLIPATISNNVPGTEYSLGTDTALNVIVESCDRVKQSADASRRRVFVVEVQGGNSGCLAALGGLASGATAVYTPENGISLQTLQSDIGHLRQQYLEERGCSVGRVILRNENASNVYTTEVISNIIAEEGGLLFSSKTAVLGHLQQGGMPSPLDRYRGTRLGVNCVKWIEEMCAAAMIVPEEPLEPLPTRSQLKRKYRPRVYAPENESVMVIGIIESRVKMTPLAQLIPKADFKRRMPQTRWWDQVEQLVRVMAKFGQYPGEEKIQFKS